MADDDEVTVALPRGLVRELLADIGAYKEGDPLDDADWVAMEEALERIVGRLTMIEDRAMSAGVLPE